MNNNDINNNEHMVLNPFQFLGLTIESTLTDLKKVYYELSLYCHPDKGGKAEDMIILHNCYLYVKKQLLVKSEDNLEDVYNTLETDFETFCKEQKNTPPLFREIFDESNDFIKKFNETFETKRMDDLSTVNVDNAPIYTNSYIIGNSMGYSNDMEKSEYTMDNIMNGYSAEIDINYDNEKKPVKKMYNKSILKYQQPLCSNNNSSNNSNLINYTEIDNFGHVKGNLQMNDYMEAFSSHDIHQNKNEWNKNIGMTDEQYHEILSNDDKDIDKFERDLKKYMNNRTESLKIINKNVNEQIPFDVLQHDSLQTTCSLSNDNDEYKKQNVIQELDSEPNNMQLSSQNYELLNSTYDVNLSNID